MLGAFSEAPEDVDGFVALVRQHDPALRRLALRLLVDRSRVDDVLRELPGATLASHAATFAVR